MSIFKSTFFPFVCRQLNARQDLISQESGSIRRNEFIQYTTAKNSWVRMQSFVNYDSPDGKYKGSQLAKKFILESGLLTNKEGTNDFSLRGGFANRLGSYGGDFGNRDYGIVPMPGITSVKVKNKSAYGSLREATVEFICHDKKQLDDLEILYMRPGFAVLLEWGWSLYMDTYEKEDYKKEPDSNPSAYRKDLSKIRMKNFDGGTINSFEEGLTQQSVYDRIEFLQHKYSGNYEGMLGFVRNYSWSLQNNGSYKCTTVLISIGEVLQSLKMNSPMNPTPSDDGNQKTMMSDFEKYLKNNDSIDNSDKIIDIDLSDLRDKSYIDCNIIKGETVDSNTGERLRDITINYIQFGYLIGIIAKKWNLFDKSSQPIVNIELPFPNVPGNRGSGFCLASEDSITIDPDVCIIKNSRAKFITGNDSGFNIIGNVNPNQSTMKEYIDDSGYGVIGNIYLKVDFVVDVYNSISNNNKGVVTIYDLISELLKNMELALGCVNQFDIYSENNKIVIIDKFYLEDGLKSKKDTKFRFNINGKDSIIRGHDIQSKIFAEQATLIAIAAQSRENLGSIQTSTNNYLNKNVSDRLIKSLSNSYNKGNSDNDEIKKLERQQLIDKVINLRGYIQDYLYKGRKDGNKQAAREYLNTVINVINVDTNYRAIIPICLKFDIDGIGGAIIGNIFTVNKDVLPSDYVDKNLGFIVTGIEHIIEKSDWITSYVTQICLLDDGKVSERRKVLEIDKVVISDEIVNKVEQNVRTLEEQVDAFRKLVQFIQGYVDRRSIDVDPKTKIDLPSDIVLPIDLEVVSNDNYKKLGDLKPNFDSQFEVFKQKCIKISQKSYLEDAFDDGTLVDIDIDRIPDEDKIVNFNVPNSIITSRSTGQGRVDETYQVSIRLKSLFDIKALKKLILGL